METMTKTANHERIMLEIHERIQKAKTDGRAGSSNEVRQLQKSLLISLKQALIHAIQEGKQKEAKALQKRIVRESRTIYGNFVDIMMNPENNRLVIGLRMDSRRYFKFPDKELSEDELNLIFEKLYKEYGKIFVFPV